MKYIRRGYCFTTKDETFFRKRLVDLANQSYRSGIYTYTNFLTQEEQSIYLQTKQEIGSVKSIFFGGTEGCERQVLRFGDEAELGYDAGFPICCIQISPVAAKFSDELTHRDYLGALMSLGIERSTLGDIMIRQTEAYLFCLESISGFILENLVQIKHTNVSCKVLDEMPEVVAPQKKEVNLIVPGLRADVVIAKLCCLSRSKSITLFQEKKIFVNGRQMENNSYQLKEGDVVSVRGFGKFVCGTVKGETRKGNLNLQVFRYV